MAMKLPSNQEDREVYLREHRATGFVEAITDARRQALDTVIMTVDAFAGEPPVLYVALEYAHHSGVAITMASAKGLGPRSSRSRPSA
jgi:hypothetical protein